MNTTPRNITGPNQIVGIGTGHSTRPGFLQPTNYVTYAIYARLTIHVIVSRHVCLTLYLKSQTKERRGKGFVRLVRHIEKVKSWGNFWENWFPWTLFTMVGLWSL